MIIFDEVAHTYLNERTGQIVPSVTQILNFVYGSGLENAPSYFVERAAIKGTKIHKEIESFIDTEDFAFVKSEETKNFVSYAIKHKLNLKKAKTEQVLHANTAFGEVCGTADLILGKELIDYKTSKTATKEQLKKWQMQLSFYKYMAKRMGMTINKLEVLHLTAFNCEPFELEYLGDDFVLETMEMYSKGEKANKKQGTALKTVDSKSLAVLSQTIRHIAELEKSIEPIRERIKKEMEKRSITALKLGDVSITYISPSKRKAFDTNRFRQENEALYNKYVKETEVKSSIRIKLED